MSILYNSYVSLCADLPSLLSLSSFVRRDSTIPKLPRSTATSRITAGLFTITRGSKETVICATRTANRLAIETQRFLFDSLSANAWTAFSFCYPNSLSRPHSVSECIYAVLPLLILDKQLLITVLHRTVQRTTFVGFFFCPLFFLQLCCSSSFNFADVSSADVGLELCCIKRFNKQLFFLFFFLFFCPLFYLHSFHCSVATAAHEGRASCSSAAGGEKGGLSASEVYISEPAEDDRYPWRGGCRRPLLGNEGAEGWRS